MGLKWSKRAMKLLAGCVVSAGLVLAGWSANAQMLAPYGAGRSSYQAVSDFDEPYGGLPPAPPPYGAPPPYAPAAPYGYEPALMPPHQVYAVLRENGFLPLGIPRRQGSVYGISAMGPDGEDGWLLIDGRNGRIIRFAPAYRMGRMHGSELTGAYGAQAAVPPPTSVRGGPRPPASIPNVANPHVANSHVASRTVPLPVPKPAETAAAQPQTQPQVSAAASTGTVGEVKPPQPAIRPTQDMPAVQGLE